MYCVLHMCVGECVHGRGQWGAPSEVRVNSPDVLRKETLFKTLCSSSVTAEALA